MSVLDYLRKGKQPAKKEDPEPRGGSGRGHAYGFLDLEELNSELRHPQGHKVFDKMYRGDGDVHQVSRLCINPMLASEWLVEAYGGQEATDDDLEVAEATRWMLFENMDLISHLAEFLPVLFRSGFAPGEVPWAVCEYDPPPKREDRPSEAAQAAVKPLPGEKVGAKPAAKPAAGAKPAAKQLATDPKGGADGAKDAKSGADGANGGGETKKYLVPTQPQLRLPRSVWKWTQKKGKLTAIHQYLPAGSGGSSNGQSFEYDGVYGSGAGNAPGSVELDMTRGNGVYYRVGAEGDNWEGVSLLRPAYKHWYIKDTIERIDAIAQEREALGVPVLYAPPGASPDQLTAMETVLKNFRAAEQGYVIMPGMKAGVAGTPDGAGWLLELMGFDRTGSGRDPQPSLEYHGQKIAAAFIAEFMRLGHGSSGSRATAQVQVDPFTMAIKALARVVLEPVINECLVAPFVAYNFADAKHAPKVRMGLVDASSLADLADYVLKLTQVGALLPDQELEEYLRARGDMPPPNPQSVSHRAGDEEQIRRQIVGGNVNPTPLDQHTAETAQAQAEVAGEHAIGVAKVGAAAKSAKPDPYGSNAKTGKHKNGKPAGAPTRSSGAAKGAGGAGGGKPRGDAKTLDRNDYLRAHELHVDLDAIERYMDDLPSRMQHECGPTMRALAAGDDASKNGLHREAYRVLSSAYSMGREFVANETQAQGYQPDQHSLDRGARDRMAGAVDQRADLIADDVHHAVKRALAGHDLAHGQEGKARAAAEKAGNAALRRAAHDHGVAAMLHGRHDAATELSEAGAPLQAVYTAVLDGNVCGPCHAADDGVPRDLDDPVRLEHQPPNQMCDSLDSGSNRCRCFETYVLTGGEPVQLDAGAGVEVQALPEWLQNVITLLISRGMDASRALAVSVQVAEQVVRSGRTAWPGLRGVADDAAGAREALAWLQSRR